MKPLIFCLIISLGISNRVKAQYVSAQDSLQLVALYNSTNGPSWYENAGWLNGPVGGWYGVQVSDGKILKLALQNNHLIGFIPNFNLPDISIINLSQNQLSGTLSNFNTPKLKVLALSYNQLSGPIPDFNFPNLTDLELYNNQLNGTIPNFNFPKLSSLVLNVNQLTGTIPDFSGTDISKLDLSNNQLSGTIPNFNLPNLASLYLYNNALTGNIPNLNSALAYDLVVSNNQLTGGIPDFSGKKMVTCLLDNNLLTGNIPDFNKYLNYLDLSHNQLSGIIPDFNQPNMNTLTLNDNLFTGSIPNFNLPLLQNLNLSSNQLSGSIPNFNLLPNLLGLYLSNNQLSGSIPNFNFLPGIQELDLSQNQLVDSISNFNFPNLFSLNLSNNQLSGAIPDFYFPGLRYFYLYSNYFLFSGLEEQVQHHYYYMVYSPQASIKIHTTDSSLYVSAGGTLSNNIFKWYKDNQLVATKTGDSTFVPVISGYYSATVKNTIANQLTLFTDTVFFQPGRYIKAELVWDKSCPEAGVKPIGVVADGVSRLYIKITKRITDSSHVKKVSVSIKDTLSRNSTLWGRVKKATNMNSYSDEASFGGSSFARWSDSSDGGNFWFWYLSPEDFSRSDVGPYATVSGRADTIRVTVTYTDESKDSADLVIKIVRPPLVLVHGLASGASAWNNFYQDGMTPFIKSPLFKQKKALEMSGRNAFYDNANLLLSGDDNSLPIEQKLNSTLQGNILAIRKMGYAANQVDYVCHSMGGIMLRSAVDYFRNKFFANDPSSFKYNNYGKGFVHKFITINTPHNGSPIADAITEYTSQLPVVAQAILSLLYKKYPTSQKPFDFIVPVNPNDFLSDFQATPAVKNLQVSTTAGGIHAGATLIKNHLIASDVDFNALSSAGSKLTQIKPVLKLLDFMLDAARDKAVGPAKVYLTGLYYLNTTARALSFIEWYSAQKGFPDFLGDGDLIVPMASETARQDTSTSNITKFYNSAGSFIDANHVAIVDRADVGQKVMDLLNANINGPSFDFAIPANDDPDPPQIQFKNVTNALVNNYDTAKIKITNPFAGNTIYADSTISISFNLKDTVGLAYIKLYFQDSDSATISHQTNQQFSFTISPSYPGREAITAVAVYDLPGQTEYHIDTLSVNVVNLAAVQGFKIDEDSINITAGIPLYPNYQADYNGTWVPVPNNSADISVDLQKPAVINYSLQNGFVGLQQNTSAAYISYNGFKDTIVFKSFLPVSSNCINKSVGAGNLSNPLIWSKGFVPDVCDSVVISHNIVADISATIRSLRIDQGGSFTLKDSSVQFNIGDPDNANQTIDNYGTLVIIEGRLNINGRILFQPPGSFNMTGGAIIIDGNTGAINTSIPNGVNLFNVAASMQSFSFTGGMLQIIDPPLGALSQAINCPFNFGDSSVLKFGNGISTTESNNVNGFGGNLLPAQVGKLIFDPVIKTNNRVFVILNPLDIRTGVNVLSGNLIQNAPLKVGH